VSPVELLKLIEPRFDEVWAPGILYRATGVTIRGLIADRASMPDLFGELGTIAARSQFMGAIDHMSKKYGRHTITLASSLAAIAHSEVESKRKKRNIQQSRDRFIISHEMRKKTLYLPYLGVVK
jgi:hypothetical protein